MNSYVKGLTYQESVMFWYHCLVGQHFRDLDPEGTSHPNIRAVMEHGLDKVVFASPPLTRR